MSGLLNKVKNFFIPGNEYEDDEEYDDEELEQEQVEEKPQKMSTNNQQTQTPFNNSNTSNFKVLQPTQPARMELLNFTMLSYDMTGEISSYIKNKKPIIVNMEKLAPHEMQRAVDFLTGACMALNGSVEKVTDNIFIFAPEHVNIKPDNLKTKGISRNN